MAKKHPLKILMTPTPTRPDPAPLEPPPPPHLTPTEAETYRTAAHALAGPPTSIQATMLEAYAIERTRWQDAEQFLRENGPTITLRNDKGEVRAILEAPHLKIAQRARDATLNLANRLGLDTSSLLPVK